MAIRNRERKYRCQIDIFAFESVLFQSRSFQTLVLVLFIALGDTGRLFIVKTEGYIILNYQDWNAKYVLATCGTKSVITLVFDLVKIVLFHKTRIFGKISLLYHWSLYKVKCKQIKLHWSENWTRCHSWTKKKREEMIYTVFKVVLIGSLSAPEVLATNTSADNKTTSLLKKCPRTQCLVCIPYLPRSLRSSNCRFS